MPEQSVIPSPGQSQSNVTGQRTRGRYENRRVTPECYGCQPEDRGCLASHTLRRDGHGINQTRRYPSRSEGSLGAVPLRMLATLRLSGCCRVSSPRSRSWFFARASSETVNGRQAFQHAGSDSFVQTLKLAHLRNPPVLSPKPRTLHSRKALDCGTSGAAKADRRGKPRRKEAAACCSAVHLDSIHCCRPQQDLCCTSRREEIRVYVNGTRRRQSPRPRRGSSRVMLRGIRRPPKSEVPTLRSRPDDFAPETVKTTRKGRGLRRPVGGLERIAPEERLPRDGQASRGASQGAEQGETRRAWSPEPGSRSREAQ